MVVFHIISDSFLAISDKLCIFAPMDAKNTYLSDLEIVEGLIARDERITREFFYVRCSSVFGYVIKKLYLAHPNKSQLTEDLIRDLYAYLMEDDAKALRRFSFKCPLTAWLLRVAYRFFIGKRDKELKENERTADFVSVDELKNSSNEDFQEIDALKVVDQILEAMPDEELAYILRRRYLDDCSYDMIAAELGKKKSYLYVLKQRALEMAKDIYDKLGTDYE